MRRMLVAAASVMFASTAWGKLPLTFPGGARPSSPGSIILAAADGTLGMALMSAVVNSAGTLVRGSGVESAARTGTGTYRVRFTRSIANCTATANAGNSVVGGSNTLIYAVIYHWEETAFLVRMTSPLDISASDAPFHLIVFCPK